MIFGFANALVGRFHGGMGYVNIVCSLIFAGMTGSALADASGHIAVMTRDDGKQQKVGVFSLRGEAGTVSVNLPDGRYPNLLGEDQVEVLAGLLRCDGEPVWICAAKNMEVLP